MLRLCMRYVPHVAPMAAHEAITCAGESCPQDGNLAPKSGEFVQGASLTDDSCSCFAPGLKSLVVAPEWLGCVYKGQ